MSAKPSTSTIADGPVGGLLLAAGFSRRYGSRKLLAQLPNDTPVIAQTLNRLCQSLTELVIVCRPGMRDDLMPSVETARSQFPTAQLSLIEFAGAESGMGASLAYAAAHAAPHWSAALVCLADMPFIEPSTYAAVAAASRRDSIVVPTHLTRRGHPIAFGADFFGQLTQLGGDEGARELLHQHARQTVALPTDDGGILLDIDTPSDLKQTP